MGAPGGTNEDGEIAPSWRGGSHLSFHMLIERPLLTCQLDPKNMISLASIRLAQLEEALYPFSAFTKSHNGK